MAVSHPEPTYPQYAALRAEADHRAGPSVDPYNVNTRIPDLVARRGHDWDHAVLGRPYPGPSGMYSGDMELLLLANEQDITPPLPAGVLEARQRAEDERIAAARIRAERIARLDAEWTALVKAMPIAVMVAHNYQSGRHCKNGYVQGGDHIIAGEHLVHGRFARLASSAFCETKSNTGSLYFPNMLTPDERRPTCKACIRAACKITGLVAPAMLGEPAAGARAGIPNRRFKK
jgi:hypothetical protein